MTELPEVHNPDYDTIVDNYVNGNRKDFATQVKEYGLINFIEAATTACDPDRQGQSPFFTLVMVKCAINLGDYK